MEHSIQFYLEKLLSFFTLANLKNLLESAQPHIQELQNFHFYFSNPVFGLLILITFLALIKVWGIKKAFSYCLFVTSILYFTTRIIAHLGLPIEGSTITYADILKFLAIIIISTISIYYCFLKNI